ncbi:Partner of Y14 and mago [Daldinia childiae]|uniref:Partner of Y14 and mago n=1 Tax=Daldinia childiae TaxID=326645 RepID=UPI0014473D62|nr:Partner of Y14 and mago [Daldinia childiae]KAF3064936.1 Partner of Y14 and mago [Daldinia childiae]
MPSEPSTAGIVTDENSGERQIPESVRADGTTRKAIKIRPGYRPPEDVELYKNRTAESFRNRGKGGVIGAEGLKEQKQETAAAASAASNKNAKRREARKKAKQSQDPAEATNNNASGDTNAAKAEDVADPEAEREKKARNLKKKLKQAKDLKSKKEGGESLLPEQIAKVIKINELVRELEALGFDADGEPKTNTDTTPETAKEG